MTVLKPETPSIPKTLLVVLRDNDAYEARKLHPTWYICTVMSCLSGHRFDVIHTAPNLYLNCRSDYPAWKHQHLLTRLKIGGELKGLVPY